jgi:dTMP kinase
MKKATLICFNGIDGSGKTTISTSFKSTLEKLNISCKYYWCGWRGFESWLFKPAISIIKRIYKIRSSSSGSNKISRLNRKIPAFSYFAIFDYILRVLPNLLLSLYRYEIVITDRYIYDVIVGFSVFNKKNEKFVFKTLTYLFPKPDIIFLIEVPDNIAFSRKDDVPSIEYLTKQKVIYSNCLKGLTKKVIDGTKNKDEILNMVVSEVANYSCERSGKIWVKF